MPKNYKKTYYKRYKSLTSNWRWWYRVGYNEFEPLILSIDDKVVAPPKILYLLNLIEIYNQEIAQIAYL